MMRAEFLRQSRGFSWACGASMVLLILLSMAGCKRGAAQQGGGQATSAEHLIYTTFYPTQYFCERIIGGGVEGIEVRCLLPSDADPIFWMPSRAEIGEFQSADLVILNGAGFEKWVALAALPASRLVNTAAPLAGDFIEYDTTTHSHGETGGHTHEGTDGHTWLDPQNALIQAREILTALVRQYPEHAAEFKENFEAMRGDLVELDERWRMLTPRLESVQLLASHPAYNYLARRYGWSITNFALEPEVMPSEAEWAELAAGIGEAAERRGLMLWEAEPIPSVSQELQRRFDVMSVVCAPAELQDEVGVDYLEVMSANIDRLEAVLDVMLGH